MSPSNYNAIGKKYVKHIEKGYDEVSHQDASKNFALDATKQITDACLLAKKTYNGDCYICHFTKRDRLIHGAIHMKTVVLAACPTPNTQQILYKFNTKTEELTFLWAIPDEDSCSKLYARRHILGNNTLLTASVCDYIEGRLYYKSKELNGEIKKPGYTLEEKHGRRKN